MSKYMQGKMSIENYVDRLLNFKADIKLPKTTQQTVGLAASGNHHSQNGIYQLGSIRDSDHQVVVKVFENDKKDCYLAYFSFSGHPPEYTIISHPDFYKYYLIQADGSVTIPKSDGIDPLNDQLHVSFPMDIFQISMKDLFDQPENILIGMYGSELIYKFLQKEMDLTITLLPTENMDVFDASKAVIIDTEDPKFTQNSPVIPIKEGAEKIPLPTDLSSASVLCLYR